MLLFVSVLTREKLLLKILRKLNLDNFFDFVIGSKEGIPLKPDPYMLDYCIKKFRIKPNETVGDSDNDIIPANNLGVYSVYVNYGYGKLNEKIVPKLTLSKMSDFKNYFSYIFILSVKKLLISLSTS